MAVKPLYRRVILKVSGEALMGEQPYGIDPAVIDRIAADVLTVRDLGVEVALAFHRNGGEISMREFLPLWVAHREGYRDAHLEIARNLIAHD